MDPSFSEKVFPKHFFWGCATSAHQIEGGLLNDWSEWEVSEKRKQELERKGLNPTDFISGRASNSFEESNADIACLKQLGVNAYRFSVDWSRIEPEEGVFNTEALDFYLKFIKTLRANHIEPFVTLWHWPVPLWVKEKGGWESKSILPYFTRFVEKVGTHLNEEVNFWVTLNEPMVYAANSFLTGIWPPQKKNPVSYLRVVTHLISAHRNAYDVLKRIDTNNKIGIAKHNIYFEKANGNIVNTVLEKTANWWWNLRFLLKIQDKQDFIGLNYYFHSYVNNGFDLTHPYERVSDLKWGLMPKGIFHLLMDLKQFKKPVYILENGLADKGDQHRAWYISEILQYTHQAIEQGVDVRGYFHWSLIDNFEWAEGFHPRFGLFEVDFQNFTRVARSSAAFYGDICRRNRI